MKEHSREICYSLTPTVDPVKSLWFKMACTCVPNIVLHVLSSTSTSWGYFRPQKSILPKIAIFGCFWPEVYSPTASLAGRSITLITPTTLITTIMMHHWHYHHHHHSHPDDITTIITTTLITTITDREERHADFVKALKAWAAPWIMQVG